MLVDRLVALVEAALIVVEDLQGLPQLEQVLRPPRPFQPRAMVAWSFLQPVCRNRANSGVALPRHDGPQDRHPGYPSDVAENLGQLDVPLLQGLLHPLDVATGVGHQALAMALVTAPTRTGSSGGRRPATAPGCAAFESTCSP